jgi:hypothetical protein
MKLQRVLFKPSVQVKFTRIEISVLMQLSAMHYDGVCKAAGQCGGFLYGIANGNDTLSWREIDLLGKICEGASFWERSSSARLQRKGAIGRRLFGDMLRLHRGLEFAGRCAEPVGKHATEQINVQERKPYWGPLPYLGESGLP